METNCKDCNRLIDECTCLEDTINFTKYTRDQKRRAVQEIVRRLNEFDSAMKLVRQFDITEQDVLEYTAARFVNSSKYTIGHGPASPTTPAYDPYTGLPIGNWAVEAPAKSIAADLSPVAPRPYITRSMFDQAVEEATELRTRAMEAAAIRSSQLQGLLVPHPSLKSYTDWA